MCKSNSTIGSKLLAVMLLSLWIPAHVVQAYVDQDTMLVEAEDNYQRLVDEGASYQEVCFAERHLARTKMLNKEKLSLTEEDVERLNEKSAMDCEEKPPVETYVGPYYVKTTAGEDQNQYIKIASEVSNNNLDFILTLEQENGLWTPDRVHSMNRNGTVDYGFCGLNSAYHWNYIQSDAFKDPRNQLEYCYNIFKQNPGRFYGYYKRYKHRGKFVYKQA